MTDLIFVATLFIYFGIVQYEDTRWVWLSTALALRMMRVEKQVFALSLLSHVFEIPAKVEGDGQVCGTALSIGSEKDLSQKKTWLCILYCKKRNTYWDMPCHNTADIPYFAQPWTLAGLLGSELNSRGRRRRTRSFMLTAREDQRGVAMHLPYQQYQIRAASCTTCRPVCR